MPAVRVLVVEDEAKMAGLLSRGLREEGHAVDVAECGEDALSMGAGATPYDVIILDVMLPGVDGFETCRGLRKQDVRTPVLILTAGDVIDDRAARLETGADDYLAKPFPFSELLARLHALQAPRPARGT